MDPDRITDGNGARSSTCISPWRAVRLESISMGQGGMGVDSTLALLRATYET
jgi:hypothetical protein